MIPERKKLVNGYLIEEFYWNRDLVVYVNNRLFVGNFEDAVKYYESK